MDNLKYLFRDKFAKKKLNKTVAIYMIFNILSKKFRKNINGIFKNDILYIRSDDPHVCFEIFLNKKNILAELNSKLENMWYWFKIKDIRKSKY